MAVAASIRSPVRSICMARFGPIDRVSGTIGVEQNSPMRTPGVAKRASVVAMARSQLATSWQPAAVATPCTCAMTGWGIDCTVVISRLQVVNSSDASSPSHSVSSVRSWPAEKAGPAPARTTTRPAAPSRACCSSRISSSDSALRRSGRLSVIRVIGSTSSTRRCSHVLTPSTVPPRRLREPANSGANSDRNEAVRTRVRRVAAGGRRRATGWRGSRRGGRRTRRRGWRPRRARRRPCR